MSLQSDLDRLDLSRAQIYFKPGSVTKTGLLIETAKRVKAGMKDQFDRDVTAKAILVGRFVDVTVTQEGEKEANTAFQLPDELEVL